VTCADVLKALGNQLADPNCFQSADLTTTNPLTTPANNSLVLGGKERQAADIAEAAGALCSASSAPMACGRVLDDLEGVARRALSMSGSMSVTCPYRCTGMMARTFAPLPAVQQLALAPARSTSR